MESEDQVNYDKKFFNYEEFRQTGLQKIEKIKKNMKLDTKKKM